MYKIILKSVNTFLCVFGKKLKKYGGFFNGIIFMLMLEALIQYSKGIDAYVEAVREYHWDNYEWLGLTLSIIGVISIIFVERSERNERS